MIDFIKFVNQKCTVYSILQLDIWRKTKMRAPKLAADVGVGGIWGE
jgi:hypothetical protein